MAGLYDDSGFIPNETLTFPVSGQYPGSSGRWAGDPTYGPSGGMRNGLYPGDAARLAMGVPPLSTAALSMAGDPVWDSVNAIWINPQTKKPFTGRHKSGFYIQNGISQGNVNPASYGAPNINPNDPNQRYKPVEIPKLPDISAATKDLVQQFKDTANQSLKGFEEHLKDFSSGVTGANKATQAAITAAGPTADALAKQQAQLSSALTSSQNQYQALNQDTAARERGAVQEAKDLLPSYDAAGQAIADRQLQEVVKNLGRYKVGSGTPMSLGGDESRILAQGAADVLLPLKQAEINRRYDIISGLELPTTQDIAGRETSRIAQFNPQVAQQIYQTGTATTGQIQALKEHVAGMSFDNAERTLRDLGLPENIINTILGGDISQLSQLANLEDVSAYRGLQDVLGVNPSQPIYYDQGVPGYPVPSRYSPTSTGNTQPPNLGRNAPIQVGPTGTQTPRQPNAVDIAYKQQTGFYPWEDPQYTDEVYQIVASRMGQGTPAVASGAPYVDMSALNRSAGTLGDFNQSPSIYA